MLESHLLGCLDIKVVVEDGFVEVVLEAAVKDCLWVNVSGCIIMGWRIIIVSRMIITMI